MPPLVNAPPEAGKPTKRADPVQRLALDQVGDAGVRGEVDVVAEASASASTPTSSPEEPTNAK